MRVRAEELAARIVEDTHRVGEMDLVKIDWSSQPLHRLFAGVHDVLPLASPRQRGKLRGHGDFIEILLGFAELRSESSDQVLGPTKSVQLGGVEESVILRRNQSKQERPAQQPSSPT